MSLPAVTPARVRSTHPIAVELALVVAVLFGTHLWRRLVTRLQSVLLDASPVPVGAVGGALLVGGFLLAGLVLYAGAYASLRGVDVGLALPSADDARLLGVAAVAPAALVALTKLVALLTGVQYNSLTKTAYAVDVPVSTFLWLVAVGLLVGVLSLLVVCQVVVQGSFERVVGDGLAVVLTTLLTGFVLTSTVGGLATIPDRGKLFGAVWFVVALGVALSAADHVDRAWVWYLSYAPVGLFVVVVSAVAETDTVAGVAFAATHVGVLGLAAVAYERTDSLVAPALAYASVLFADQTVVYVFEAGMRGW